MNIYKQSLYIGIIRICANLVMIGAIFLSMYQASRWPGWPSEVVFSMFFFGIVIPDWIAAWLLAKWIRKRWPSTPFTLVDLPGLGKQLVAWQIRQPVCYPPNMAEHGIGKCGLTDLKK